MSDPAIKPMSIEEHLRTEEKSPVKREYVGGFVYPLHGQAGASKKHTLIGTNIIGTLYQDARKAGCRLYQNDMKLVVEGSASFFYPDVMLACESDDGSTYAETSPCLLFEVLTENSDRHERFAKYLIYTTIPSLQTYLIVEQRERRVYAYGREGERWVLSNLHGEGTLTCPAWAAA